MYCVYKITNTLNNKVYIGKTKNFNRRMKEHCSTVTLAIGKAICKYGKDNFLFEILYQTDDIDLLGLKEFEYINIFNSMVPNGYNYTKKTDSKIIFADSTRRLLSISSQKKIRPKGASSTSKYFGVALPRRSNHYATVMVFDGKRIRRSANSEMEAAEQYDKISIYLWGVDAKLNFPEKLSFYLSLDLDKNFSDFMSMKSTAKRITYIPDENTKTIIAIKAQRAGKSKTEYSSSKYIGVRLPKNGKSFTASIQFNGKTYHKKVEDEIKAAELYDKMALFWYGNCAKLNFPQKLPSYMLENLEEINKEFISPIRKLSIYNFVTQHKTSKKWVVSTKLYTDKLRLGLYESELEVARIVDYIIIYFKLEKSLNFPTYSYDSIKIQTVIENGINHNTKIRLTDDM